MRNDDTKQLDLSKYHVPIIGTGETTSALCGTVKYVYSCGDENHSKSYLFHNCSSPMCPDCYRYWVSRACDRVVPFLMSIYNDIGVSDSLRNSETHKNLIKLSKNRYSHWVISLPSDNLRYESPFDYLKKLKELNLFGVAIYHPYRHSKEGKDMLKELRKRGFTGASWDIWRESGLCFNPDTIEFGPHLHLVSVGHIPAGVLEYYRSRGCFIRKIRDIGFEYEEVEKVVRYQLNHSGYCGRSKSYRYFGMKKDMKMVMDSAWSVPEPLLCPDCGEPMHRYREEVDGSLVDEGLILESHRVYTCHLFLGKTRKPKTVKYDEMVSQMKRIMKELKKKEEYLKCTNQTTIAYC